MRIFEGEDNSLIIEGPICFGGFADAGCHRDYRAVSITKTGRLPARFARGLSNYQKLEKLWIWCDVYRTAMPHILALPQLAVLDILCVSRPGRRMCTFANAEKLQQLRCNNGLTESDLIAISTAPSLEELGAQFSGLTSRGLRALLSMESLTAIDLECAGVTDNLAAQIAESRQLLTLELGNNPISDVALKKICSMSQLKGLDIWQTNISVSGIEQLARLENLEFLSLGMYGDDEPLLSGDSVIPILDAIPSLKRVWLDGVSLNPAQGEMLKSRYEFFRN